VAAKAIEEREKKVAGIAEQIEGGLTVVGATAIEDKLQVRQRERKGGLACRHVSYTFRRRRKRRRRRRERGGRRRKEDDESNSCFFVCFCGCFFHVTISCIDDDDDAN